MDLKKLLEAIYSVSVKLKSANRIIEICNSDFYDGGINVQSKKGSECYLSISPEDIREVALVQKKNLESEIKILHDAQNKAELVIAELLPNPNVSN
ncbi:hypothetical protein E1A40_08735 [Salmonella enterica subsp. enterica serovar Aba]|nr:hypothetical protein [Salmonella enterica subsp. enterica serovar Aba]ECG5317592.1 hypothetical protein [Salmonella enterica subsp. enterica serovar Aba]EJN2863943.1 hypothetical protein [Salmonella enterica subsp. enterica serovar Yaba]